MHFISLLTLISIAAPAPDALYHNAQPQADNIVLYHDDEQPAATPESQTAPLVAESDATAPQRYVRSGRHYDSLLVAVRDRRLAQAQDEFVKQFINIDPADSETVSNLPDSVFEARLKTIMSPIDMTYNAVVKRHIIAYTSSRKRIMEKILQQSEYYFPMIEQELDSYGLPIELRMLAAIESALAPNAVSRAGATGMWQFMYSTGKLYGLEINSFVDQRRDPVLSTKAACRYLKDLYDIYGDWTLALAAYNCGPGNVNKAIKRAGDNNISTFWDIYEVLPKETRDYVPSFIAATYTYVFYREHGLSKRPSELPLATDTLMISKPMHFEQVCSTLDIPTDLLRLLNPQYKSDIIPASGKSYPLTLPQIEIGRFLENESMIHAKDTVYMAQYLKPAVSKEDPSKKTFAFDSFTYKVKSGDTLGSIAKKYNVTVKQLMKWNKLTNANKLRIGQQLEIYR